MNTGALLEKEFEKVVSTIPEVFKSAEPIKMKRFLSIADLPEGWLKDYVKFAYPLTEAPLQFHIANGGQQVNVNEVIQNKEPKK